MHVRTNFTLDAFSFRDSVQSNQWRISYVIEDWVHDGWSGCSEMNGDISKIIPLFFFPEFTLKLQINGEDECLYTVHFYYLAIYELKWNFDIRRNLTEV